MPHSAESNFVVQYLLKFASILETALAREPGTAFLLFTVNIEGQKAHNTICLLCRKEVRILLGLDPSAAHLTGLPPLSANRKTHKFSVTHDEGNNRRISGILMTRPLEAGSLVSRPPEAKETSNVLPQSLEDNTWLSPSLKASNWDPHPLEVSGLKPRPLDPCAWEPYSLEASGWEPRLLEVGSLEPRPLETGNWMPRPLEASGWTPPPMEAANWEPRPPEASGWAPRPTETPSWEPRPQEASSCVPRPLETSQEAESLLHFFLSTRDSFANKIHNKVLSLFHFGSLMEKELFCAREKFYLSRKFQTYWLYLYRILIPYHVVRPR
jgi:hypothetical protein